MSPGPRTRRVPRLGIEQKRGTAEGIRRDYLRVLFFARGNRSWIGFLCMLHSKRVFSLSRTLGTRVLLSLNRRFLGGRS